MYTLGADGNRGTSSSEMFMAEQALMEPDASCEQPALYIRPGRAIHLGWALSHEKVELMDVPRHTGERVVQKLQCSYTGGSSLALSLAVLVPLLDSD